MVTIRDLETNCPLSTHEMETNALYSSGFGKTTNTVSFAALELRFRYQVITRAFVFGNFVGFVRTVCLRFASVFAYFASVLPLFCLRFVFLLPALCLRCACGSLA